MYVSMCWGMVKWPQYALHRWHIEHEMYMRDAGTSVAGRIEEVTAVYR